MPRSRFVPKIPPIDYRIVLVVLAVFFTLVLNARVLGHFYDILSALGAYDRGFAISAPFVLILASLVVFTPFSWRYLFKPFFVVLIVTSALAHYGMMKYGIVFDRGMMENVIETNQLEAASYFSVPALLWFVATGIVPVCVLLIVPVRYPSTVLRGVGQRIVMMLVPLVLLGGIGAFISRITHRSGAITRCWARRSSRQISSPGRSSWSSGAIFMPICRFARSARMRVLLPHRERPSRH